MQGSLSPAPDTPEGFPQTRLEAEGQTLETGAPVTAAVVLGDRVVTAHGDGALRVFEGSGPPREIPAHHGVVLSMAAADDAAVVTGGDDGRWISKSVQWRSTPLIIAATSEEEQRFNCE